MQLNVSKCIEVRVMRHHDAGFVSENVAYLDVSKIKMGLIYHTGISYQLKPLWLGSVAALFRQCG